MNIPRPAFYKRNLPHLQPIGGIFFVTFRLKNSVPLVKLENLRKERDNNIKLILENQIGNTADLVDAEHRRFFGKYDNLLDKCLSGPTYLEQPEIAKIVTDKIHQFDKEFYNLLAFSVMPNHVHLLIDTSTQFSENDIFAEKHKTLDYIMFRLKGGTATPCNRLLNRTGQKFWQKESYDRLVRNNEELKRIYAYILQNPVKAKLALNWEDHPFTYGGAIF